MMDSKVMKNNGYIYTDRIPKSDEGRSVAAFYSLHYTHSDEETWRRRIETGQVLLNGRPAAPNDILTRGDRLAYHRPPWKEPDVPRNYHSLFEDENILVLAKPSGLPVLPGGGFLENTLLNLVRRHYGAACSPLHRLGRGTSGAILFTRNAQTARFLTLAMEGRRIRKVYLALASGTAMPDAFTVDAPIGPVPYLDQDAAAGAVVGAPGSAAGAPDLVRGSVPPHSPVDKNTSECARGSVFAVPAGEYKTPAGADSAVLDRVYNTRASIHAYSPHGRPSLSHVRVIRRLPLENATILEVTIPTGRPHQIRIHLGYAGFPLVGDPLYQAGGIPRPRGREDGRAARPGDGGYFLHSWKIRFPHQASGEDVEVICPPPPVLRALLGPTP